MGLGDLFKAVVDTVALPVDVLRDVKEVMIEGEEPRHFKEKLEDIVDDLNNVTKND